MRIMKKSIETYIVVDYYELEKFVNGYYEFEDRKWSFVADHECGNDCSIAFTVDGRVDKYDESKLIKFKTNPNESGWITHALLNDFARKGLIDKGQYQIEICW